MFIHRRCPQLVSAIVILTLVFSSFPLSSASAQGKDGLKRQFNVQTGKVSFIGPENGSVVPASKVLGAFINPQNPAMALAQQLGSEFGLKTPERDLQEMKTKRADDGRVTVRYQQNYQGIPIVGGELIVNTKENGDLYSMNGEISPDLSLPTQPTIDSEQAKQTALQAAAKWYQKSMEDFVVTEPALWIYDESLLHPNTHPAELVWRVEVTSRDLEMPVRELVLVNAERGNLSLHFNQIDMAWGGSQKALLASNPPKENLTSSEDGPTQYATADSAALALTPLVSTYTAGNGSSLPGTFLCNQADPNCTAGDSHAKAAHKYTIGTYNLYASQYGRDSIDNHGMTLISSVHYRTGYANAFWNGVQMVYGDASGYPLGDDVVAHELTHGVTQYESNLFYYYQPGAINESFSDLWGEYYDQTNGQGTDTAGVNWQIGEDVAGLGALRSMSNPPSFGDPDKMSSANYSEGVADSGGVHTNSGVNNKAVFLMVDGGGFNGKTVTALGWGKTAAIYYEANTNLLTSGADYSDLYYALQQACSILIGQKGITAADCGEVRDALDAVEMNAQPAPNFNTDAPYCNSDQNRITIFSDNLESGAGNWAFNNGAYTRWQFDSPLGSYAHSGNHFLYANDDPAVVTDASARLTSVTVPSGAYLHFAQAYDFETSNHYYDGGVLEYSMNGGSTWVDAGSLIDYNGYKGTIFTGDGNPLSGRSAFVGTSHGYISTRLNLASLAGRTVSFRWRMGLDGTAFAWGWWVDDVEIYQCSDISVTRMGDFNGDGKAEIAIFRPSSGTWYINGVGSFLFGGPGDIPVVGDYNGDGRADMAVFRPSNSTWYINGVGSFLFGGPGDIPVVGDYSGDGRADMAVFRPSNSTWYINGVGSFLFGGPGDIPVVGDYSGDGRADMAVFRPSNSTWYINGVGSFLFGGPGDIPVVGDYSGDGRADMAIFRPSTSTWYIAGLGAFLFGGPGDIPVVGDYNGDGRADMAIFRPSNSTWYINGVGSFLFGGPGDIPVVGDYSGDGRADMAVFRPSNSTWYINGVGSFLFGGPGDIPV